MSDCAASCRHKRKREEEKQEKEEKQQQEKKEKQPTTVSVPQATLGKGENVTVRVADSEVKSGALKSHASRMYYQWDTEIEKACYGGVWNGDVIFEDPLKQGSYKLAATPVAIKVAKKREIGSVTGPENPRKEIDIGLYFADRTRRHENLATPRECIEDNDCYYMVMKKYEKGDLSLAWPIGYHDWKKNPNMKLCDVVTIAREYFFQIASAVEHMHSEGICHGDISLENVVLDIIDKSEKPSIICKVIDFGASMLIPYDDDNKECVLPAGWSGKNPYMAPEKFAKQEFAGSKADAWSLGVTLYLMIFNERPYKIPAHNDGRYLDIASGNLKDLMKKDLTKKLPRADWTIDNVPNDLIDLLEKLLCVNADDRLTVTALLRHSFMTQSRAMNS